MNKKISDHVQLAMDVCGIDFPDNLKDDTEVIGFLNDNYDVNGDEYQEFVEYYYK